MKVEQDNGGSVGGAVKEREAAPEAIVAPRNESKPRARAQDAELWAAAAGGKASQVAEMLAKGASIDSADERGWTALMMASWDGHARCVQILLEAGADESLRQEHGLTAAKLAEAVGEPKVLELIEARAMATAEAIRMRQAREYVREPARTPEGPPKAWKDRQAEKRPMGASKPQPRQEPEGKARVHAGAQQPRPAQARKPGPR